VACDEVLSLASSFNFFLQFLFFFSPIFLSISVMFLETGARYVALAGLELSLFLSRSPKGWDFGALSYVWLLSLVFGSWISEMVCGCPAIVVEDGHLWVIGAMSSTLV
jgi:hypothetical protein